MSAEIEALAAALYAANGSALSHPTWDQLGDTTRSVWRERAQAHLLSEFA